MHRTSQTIMWSIRSTFEKCYDSFTYSKSILIRDEGPNHRFSKPKSNIGIDREGLRTIQFEEEHRALPSVFGLF
jgi:hypothetical protein